MIPFSAGAKLYDILFQIDKELAAETKEKGCPKCRGVLHSAVYPRKFKGQGFPDSNKEIIRFSFCCDTEGCRKRVTPHSVRFLGRRRYLSVVVVLCSAICSGLNNRLREELSKLIGVNLRTLSRWHSWWQTTFPNTRLWRWGKALFMPPLDPAQLCKDLVERFSAQHEITGMVNLLRFIAPLSIAVKQAN